MAHRLSQTPSRTSFLRTNRARDLAGATAAATLVVPFCLALRRVDPLAFWNDDYAISILPVFADVARAWREGHLPLLSPYSWTCGNLAGEYQYGTFSVFVNAVVVATWQTSWSFAGKATALSAAHLGALAAGAWMLARGRRLPRGLATLVAAVAALNGWMIGWGATNWFGALAAFTWLPWCWWAFEGALRPSAGSVRRWVAPAGFVYLLVAAGFPYTVGMLGLLSGWLGWGAWRRRGFRALGPLAAGWVLGLGLAAPAWLSLLEYIPGSNRAHQGGLNWSWVVPWRALPGLVLPSWTVRWPDFATRLSNHTALELAGGLVPLAGLAAALATRPGRTWRLLRGDLPLLAAALAFCVLPSAGVFRWSFRWLPLLHLVLALVGARALHGLWKDPRSAGFLGNPGLWAAGLTALTWAAERTMDPGGRPAWPLGVGGPALALGLAWAAVAGRPGWRSWTPAAVALGSLLATYRTLPMNPGVPRYRIGENLLQPAPLATDRLYVAFSNEPDWAYDMHRVQDGFGETLRVGSTNLFAGISMVNGYSPIMAAGLGKLLGVETHGNIFPPVAESLLRDEAGPDGLLARVGVDGIIIASDYPPLPVAPPPGEWEKVHASAEGEVFHRRGPARGNVWVRAGDDGRELPDVGVQTVENSRHRVVVNLTLPAGGGDASPARVAFRRPFFAGYRAALDGVPLPVGSFRGLLPTVDLPAGSRGGRLTLTYRPRALVWGAALALGSLGALAALAFLTRGRRGVNSRQ